MPSRPVRVTPPPDDDDPDHEPEDEPTPEEYREAFLVRADAVRTEP